MLSKLSSGRLVGKKFSSAEDVEKKTVKHQLLLVLIIIIKIICCQTIIQLLLRSVRRRLQAAVVGHEVILVQRFGDVIAEVGDGVDDGGLLGGTGVILLHQVVLQGDEVQRVVGNAALVHLQGDGVVHQDH